MSVKFEKDTIKTTAPLPGIPGASAIQVKDVHHHHHLPGHHLRHNVGVALTGGKANEGTPGYLSVSHESREHYYPSRNLDRSLTTLRCNSCISKNYRPIPFVRKCSRLAHYRPCKNFWLPGLRRIVIRMVTISRLEFPKWLHTVLSLVLL